MLGVHLEGNAFIHNIGCLNENAGAIRINCVDKFTSNDQLIEFSHLYYGETDFSDKIVSYHNAIAG